MTIPTLIASHKKAVIEAKLKKFSSMMNQAILRSELDNGDTSLWYVSGGSYSSGNLWELYLKDYITYTKAETKVTGGGLWTYVHLADGTGFRFNLQGSIWGTFDFCLNAEDCTPDNYAKSNKLLGIKVFSFTFAPTSTYPQYASIKDKGLVYYHGFRIDHTLENARRLCYQDIERQQCTAVIALNNWKIPDDYPWVK